MEFGTLEREIHIDATPEIVYQVVSSPEHLQEWWADEAELKSSTPGAVGELAWGSVEEPRSHVEPFTVVEADPPRKFSFRWIYDEAGQQGNSLLVTIDLVPTGKGTTLRLTESGFREKGWEIAVLEQQYREHGEGWDIFVPRLAAYAARLAEQR
jgi:uncharacterized protein YndB with AHSA1/START domain